MERISVIIPLYNSASFIEETLTSVQNQTHTNLEIICIDDCSTDSTGEIVQKRAKKDPRILYHRHKKNGGKPAIARNTGLVIATGKYVAFIDHDDLWEPTKLEEQLKHMKQEGAGFSCTNIYLLNNTTGKRDMVAWKSVTGKVSPNFTRRLLLSNFVPPASTLTERRVLQSAGNFDETLHGVDDLDMWVRISLITKCTVLNKPLATWRYANASSISANDILMLEDEVRFYEKMLKESRLSSKEKAAAKHRLEHVKQMRANRHLLAREYAEAATLYQKSNKQTRAIFTKLLPSLLRFSYVLKRHMQKEFHPIELHFDATP